MFYAILIIGALILCLAIHRVARAGEKVLEFLEEEREKREKEEDLWSEELDRSYWSSSYDEFDELDDDTDSKESNSFSKKTTWKRVEDGEKMEDVLADLQECEKWGLVPKKDLEKHKKEISKLQKKINQSKTINSTGKQNVHN